MKELIEEKKFEMRAYDKVELALLYCPGRSAESALKTLMRWIKQCQPLMQALGGIGVCKLLLICLSAYCALAFLQKGAIFI